MNPPESVTKTYGDGLVNRAIAAEILEISVSELRRREADGIYPFIVDEKGRRWFDEAMLRQTAGKPMVEKIETKKKPKLPIVANLGRLYTKEESARVFRELDKHVPLSTIIQEQDVHPETAIAIQEVYGRATGGIIVPKETLDQLGALPLRGQWPPKTGKELAAILEASLSPIVCRSCQRKPARVCSSCASGAHVNGAPGQGVNQAFGKQGGSYDPPR